MPAQQNPQYRSTELPGPRHCSILSQLSRAQRAFPWKLLGCFGYTMALTSAKCSRSSYSYRILNKADNLAQAWHHQSSMEQFGYPCELISIRKVFSTRLGTESFSHQIYTSQKIPPPSHFFLLFFSFISIYISSLHYLIPSAHQMHAFFDEPEDEDKSCLFGLELLKLVWGKLSVILSGPEGLIHMGRVSQARLQFMCHKQNLQANSKR